MTERYFEPCNEENNLNTNISSYITQVRLIHFIKNICHTCRKRLAGIVITIIVKGQEDNKDREKEDKDAQEKD